MVLAEALLRVPDARTADQFIEDKLGQGDFVHHETQIQRLPGQRLGLGAGDVGARDPARRNAAGHHRPADQTARRAGGARRDAAGDAADGQSFRAGRDHRSRAGAGAGAIRSRHRATPSTCSAKARAPPPTPRAISIPTPARSRPSAAPPDDRPLPDRPGISVKLSALHPRFEAVSRARVMTRTGAAADRSGAAAKAYDLNFTVDAEEADRLELSLDVIAAAFGDASLAGWDGFGLAIQAYQKRADAVIDYIDALARSAEPADDGAAGEGRLLGHRDQARAGARPRRLSGVHPQGDDRPELHRLRATTAGAAAAHLSAIRHPQCADGRDHPRTGRRTKAVSNFSACTAWARRCMRN